MNTKIGIYGKYEPGRDARKTIGPSLEHAAGVLGIMVDYEWIDNDQISGDCLKDFDAAFIAPGNADEDTSGILAIIKKAREDHIPCIGTCGGFQRMLTEYAANVMGYENLAHGENDPDAVDPLFSELQCRISSTFNKVLIKKGSKAYELYQADAVLEAYYCHYGLNPKYENDFIQSGITISGTDADRVARIVELADHPFFMGTLFVPQVSSTRENPHPVITGFLDAALKTAQQP